MDKNFRLYTRATPLVSLALAEGDATCEARFCRVWELSAGIRISTMLSAAHKSHAWNRQRDPCLVTGEVNCAGTIQCASRCTWLKLSFRNVGRPPGHAPSPRQSDFSPF